MAVTSEVGIYNLALNAIGERSNVASPTETSRRAEVCNLWYETVRDMVLEAAPWPEATQIDYLALSQEDDGDGVWEAGEPRPGYQYVYALPADCLRPQYLMNFESFILSERGDQQRLHCNVNAAMLCYTKVQSNVSLWSSSLRMAIAYALAAHICMPITGKPSRAKMLEDRANSIILTARVNAANANNEQHESIPEWISGRGYNTQTSTKFIYPTGSLLTIA